VGGHLGRRVGVYWAADLTLGWARRCYSTTGNIFWFTRVLKVKSGVRPRLATTCLAKWGDTWGEGLGCIRLQTWHWHCWGGPGGVTGGDDCID